MTNRNDFGYLGSDFQYCAAKALIENIQLFREIYSIVDQNCFTDPTLRRIIGVEKDLFKKNKQVPSYMEIEWELRDKETDENEIQFINETIDKLKRTSIAGYDNIKDKLISFFKWKYAILNFNRYFEKLKEGYNEENTQKFLKELSKISGIGESLGSEIKFTKDNFKKALIEGDGEVIPTGIKEIDSRLAGGIGRTEIALFTALTGFGKTTFGSVIAYNAAMRGYKVLQIYFEDKETNMLRKEAAMLYSNQQINKFKNMAEGLAETYSATLEEKAELLDRNLVLLKMAEKATTVEDIEAEVKRRINEDNFRPDLILIDYFSCLKFSRNAIKDVYVAQADCMRKIKALADDYNLAIWVMQQNNRPSPEKTAGMGNWQGSYEATQPASVWIELQRTAEQKQNGRADLIFNKTRNSQPKEDLHNIVFDNSRMLIDCSDSSIDDINLIYKEDERGTFNLQS